MKERVAIIACENYEADIVYHAITRIFDLLSLDDVVKGRERLILKPNLCLPVDYTRHLTTHPQIVKQTARVLMERCGAFDLTIADTCIGQDAERLLQVWEKSGMNRVSDELGIKKNRLDKDVRMVSVEIANRRFDLPISQFALASDIINLPKLKTHGYMMLSGCVKNLYGLLAGDAKKYFHGAAHDKITFAQLLQGLSSKMPCLFHITDAVIGIEGDGPGVKGIPKKIGALVAGRNAIAIDRVLARLICAPIGSVLTNLIAVEEEFEIELVGDPIELFITRDYKLPHIDSRRDTVTQHAISAKMLQLSINVEMCIGCNECVKNCPTGALRKSTLAPTLDGERCIKCLVCFETCCHGAIDSSRNALWNLLNDKL